jgi:flavodoxin
MKILVLYDSFFGNTQKIAEAISSALSPDHETTTVRVEAANLNLLSQADLIFIGSPTRAFSPSPNMRNFLKTIPRKSLKNVKVAVFDTRIAPDDIKPKLVGLAIKLAGYADKKMIGLLKVSGATVILPGEGFLVAESEGPLKERESERAADWAKTILARVS